MAENQSTIAGLPVA